ncbi:MAG: protein-L-isoaspartate O-methyltransferase [Magnetococcales bacterium]|nr:protein-L-isoaspartate O-methyltransferase [Magnetococcales bacterium]
MVTINQNISQARYNMVKSQIIPNRVTDERLVASFMAVAREPFVDPKWHDFVYSDHPLPISPNRYALKPLQIAWMIQSLSLASAGRVLVVGAGGGYEVALLSHVGHEVYALESDATLDAPRILSTGSIAWKVGVLGEGWPESAPYDAILCCGAVLAVPNALLRQLAPEGVLVAIVGEPGAAVMRAVRYRAAGQDQPELLFETVAGHLPGLDSDQRFIL